MSKSQKIIICGLKGVGKSSLYQKLIKKHSSNQSQQLKSSPIINYQETLIFLKNCPYLLIDTPPFNLSPQSLIEKEAQQQISELLKNCSLIFWILDLSQEPNNQVEQVNKYLWQFSVPQILIFNKKDLVKDLEYQLTLYQNLGRSQLIPFSVLKNEGLEELTEKIINSLNNQGNFTTDFNLKDGSENENKLNLVIFGPPNSGKSTLMNYLLKKERSLVSKIAGTTQEPVISD